MDWSNLIAPALGVLGGLAVALVTQGSARTRRQKAIAADLDILSKLPDGHPRRESFEDRLDSDLAAYVQPRKSGSLSLSNEWLVIGLGLVLAVGGLVSQFSDRLASGGLGAFFAGSGIVLVIRGVNALTGSDD